MNSTNETNDIAATIVNKGKDKTISDAYQEIGELAYECWKRFPSFRLLATILRTKRYATVYEAMVRAKGLEACKRSRPSLEEVEAISGIAKNILTAMSEQGITVRRWCQAHSVDIADLYNPDGIEPGVVDLLTEDFPELYKSNSTKYVTVPVGCDRKQIYNFKERRFVFWSVFLAIRVEDIRESYALKLFNWRKSQVLIKRRLQLLLEKGIEAALSYPHTEQCGGKKIPINLEERKVQQKLHDIMKRNSEADILIRKLAKRIYYPTAAEIAEELSIRERLVREFGKTPEQIDQEIKNEEKNG